MEFKIYKPTKLQMGIGYEPSELTPSERVRLIKQLCPEIEKIIVKWIIGEAVVINSQGNILAKRTKPFTDYLTEQMDAQADRR